MNTVWFEKAVILHCIFLCGDLGTLAEETEGEGDYWPHDLHFSLQCHWGEVIGFFLLFFALYEIHVFLNRLLLLFMLLTFVYFALLLSLTVWIVYGHFLLNLLPNDCFFLYSTHEMHCYACKENRNTFYGGSWIYRTNDPILMQEEWEVHPKSELCKELRCNHSN